jgi:hypothetical protein
VWGRELVSLLPVSLNCWSGNSNYSAGREDYIFSTQTIATKSFGGAAKNLGQRDEVITA